MSYIRYHPYHLTVEGPRRYLKIRYPDICYISIQNKCISFVLKSGSTIKSFGALANLAEQLSEQPFAFCHRNYLVNVHNVQSIDKRAGLVLLTNDLAVPLARRRESEFIQKWHQTA